MESERTRLRIMRDEPARRARRVFVRVSATRSSLRTSHRDRKALETPHQGIRCYGGTGEECNGFFDPSGALVQETFDLLNASIDAYEGEQQRRCGAVPQCRTDGGLRANYVPVEEEFNAPDWDHLNILGQASEAELVWPIVVDMLGLDDVTASSAVSSTKLES